MKMRPLESHDRDRIFQIIKAVGNFNEAEIRVAMELIDCVLSDPGDPDYCIYVQEDNSDVVGYVCFGPTPLTSATYDFYWMAVHPEYQGHGYGKELIRFVEQEVKKRNGKLLVLETSSLESYKRTVRTYEKAGYRLTGRIPNFYKEGDDKLVYIKEL